MKSKLYKTVFVFFKHRLSDRKFDNHIKLEQYADDNLPHFTYEKAIKYNYERDYDKAFFKGYKKALQDIESDLGQSEKNAENSFNRFNRRS